MKRGVSGVIVCHQKQHHSAEYEEQAKQDEEQPDYPASCPGPGGFCGRGTIRTRRSLVVGSSLGRKTRIRWTLRWIIARALRHVAGVGCSGRSLTRYAVRLRTHRGGLVGHLRVGSISSSIRAQDERLLLCGCGSAWPRCTLSIRLSLFRRIHRARSNCWVIRVRFVQHQIRVRRRATPRADRITC